MTKAEIETRAVMGRLGKIPRRRKKQVRKAFKSYIQAQLNDGNWDLIEWQNTLGMWATAKEDRSYGFINIKGDE